MAQSKQRRRREFQIHNFLIPLARSVCLFIIIFFCSFFRLMFLVNCMFIFCKTPQSAHNEIPPLLYIRDIMYSTCGKILYHSNFMFSAVVFLLHILARPPPSSSEPSMNFRVESSTKKHERIITFSVQKEAEKKS